MRELWVLLNFNEVCLCVPHSLPHSTVHTVPRRRATCSGLILPLLFREENTDSFQHKVLRCFRKRTEIWLHQLLCSQKTLSLSIPPL